MNFTRKVYTERREKVIDFLIGFGGWYAINSLMYVLLVSIASQVSTLDNMNVVGILLLVLPLLVNIAAIVVAGFTRYWIALGALAAFALLLFGVLVLSLLVYAICFSDSGIFR